MSTAAVFGGEGAVPAEAFDDGPAPKRIVVAYGFWIFLLSDIVLFSALFATYAVLVNATAGGPAGAQLFSPVSYTHLDVYKRQPWNGRRRHHRHHGIMGCCPMSEGSTPSGP